MTLALRFTAVSDVGRVRRDNQDSGYAGPFLLAVADGVGGSARGDVASTAAIQQVRALDVQPGNDALEQITGAVHLAHSRIADLVAESPELEGTSTTLTVALFDGTRVNLAHVGDSRAYLWRDGKLTQLTKDHTFVQTLVDEGRITDDEARVHPHRNLILKAVDGVHEPDPDSFTEALQPGDRLLLCSDGCAGPLTNDQLAHLVGTAPIGQAAHNLVNSALEAGSSDNVTVVLAEAVGLDADPETSSGTAATTAAVDPLVVGAAAHEGRQQRVPLRRRIRPEQPERVVEDPEALRYAPLPPRRRRWVRAIAALVVFLVLLAAAAYGAYRWTQTRYYIGTSAGRVVVYQGVDWKVPGVKLTKVVATSALGTQALSSYVREQVQDGIPVTSRSAGLAKIDRLVQRECPKPKPKQSTSHKKTSGHASTKQKTQGRTGTRHTGTRHQGSRSTSQPKPSATATPKPKPGCPGGAS